MALACELPRDLIRKCGRPARGVCRWCGRPYCLAHQSAINGKNPACSSQSCSMKAALLDMADSAKELAQVHNRDGYCGLPTCGAKLPGARCRICGAEYCPSHLSARLFRVVDSSIKGSVDMKQVAQKQRFFVCDQCIGLVDRYRMVDLSVVSEI